MFRFKKREGTKMCRKLGEIHGKEPEYFLENVSSFPVDINKILLEQDIAIASVSFEELQKALYLKKDKIKGLAFAKGDDLLILYSSASTEPEARFTLAHELGHCCMHMNVDSSCHIEFQTDRDLINSSQNKIMIINKEKELQADKFARDLLIPTNALLLLLKEDKTATVDDLANFFNVPKKQVLIKLDEVG